MTPLPLKHADPSKPDERLAAEAHAHMSRSPGLQLVAELLTRLREMAFPWWTADQLRQAYPVAERMHWLAERPDLRQKITTQLTGLAPRAARNKSVEFQSELIESVINEGDISLDEFERAFEPADLAVYGPASDYFHLFRRRMPWDDDSTPHQDVVGWLIGAFLADKCALDGAQRTPVMSALQVRTAIDGRVWHSRIPIHVRVAIDDARFTALRDRPHEPFGVERDLAIATPALIAASFPLKDLLGVIDVATAMLGFEEGSSMIPRSFGREQGARPSVRPEPSEEAPGAPAEPAFVAPPTVVEPPLWVPPTAADPSEAPIAEKRAVEHDDPVLSIEEESHVEEDELETTNPGNALSLDLASLIGPGAKPANPPVSSSGKRPKR